VEFDIDLHIIPSSACGYRKRSVHWKSYFT